jgi:hypothetical protein
MDSEGPAGVSFSIDDHFSRRLCLARDGQGCGSFVTNDRDLPPVPGLQILQLRKVPVMR